MSYRIHLHKWEEKIEIRDEIEVSEFEKVDENSNDEYPDYIVNKETMEFILEFYRKRIIKVAENYLNKDKLQYTTLFWYSVKSYFENININNPIQDSWAFVIQYFYLVDIYRNTDRENDILTISHW